MVSQKGFGLLEILITLVIAGIVTLLVVPSFSTLVADNRLISTNNELGSSLSIAKSEAIRRQQQITVCQSNDALSDCDPSESWSNGWIIFVDDDGDDAIDNGETVIRVHEAINSSLTLTYSAGTQLYFGSTGSLSSTPGHFTLCDDRGAPYAAGKLLYNSGRISSARDSNNDGTAENASANNLTCP